MEVIQGSNRVDTTKEVLVQRFVELLGRVFDQGENADATVRQIETSLWRELICLGAMILANAIALKCLRASEKVLRELDLHVDGHTVVFRFDADYWTELRTTFGKLRIPLFAFRLWLNGAAVTRVPARDLLPYHRQCRSSELCLEWEARVGADHPFRYAEEALKFFTHGAVEIEDTTIADHLVKVAQLIMREDLYRKPEAIRELLRNQATRDAKTGRPILYMSSDAHALRRYIGETWDAQWKMSNGIRLWCEDRYTGRILHLGGEYTWGDCRTVKAIFESLNTMGVLPKDGDYGEGVVAQLTWLSDGMPWFEEHILPLFTDVKVILDVYHLLERIADYAARLLGKKTEAFEEFYQQMLGLITGRDLRQEVRGSTPRKGHKKAPRGQQAPRHAHQRPAADDLADVDLVSLLLSELATHRPRTPAQVAAQQKLIDYIRANGYRMHYNAYRAGGYQIASGAMESLHKNGSQVRLKLPGARWLKQTSQAVVNFRMLRLAGNWDVFWSRLDFAQRLAASLQAKPTVANDNASQHATNDLPSSQQRKAA